MVILIHNLKKGQLLGILQHFNLNTRGTVPDLLLSLEAFLKEKYPDIKNTSDFDFSNVLEEIDKEVSDENKGLEQNLEFISNKVKNLEFLCIHLSEKLEEHHARFEKIENSLEELKKVTNMTNEHNIQDNSGTSSITVQKDSILQKKPEYGFRNSIQSS
ncbi:hypothetical protein JTB14_002632 [Gonioctena quinquepunctata]|nr:hypothetical protein JTB14_002632 [Gonioctena quinquepunctata]